MKYEAHLFLYQVLWDVTLIVPLQNLEAAIRIGIFQLTIKMFWVRKALPLTLNLHS